jgi:hypothetical protein
MFYFGSVIYLIRWLRESRRQDLLFCALFSAFAALTKNEGLPLAVVNALVIAARWLATRRSIDASAAGLCGCIFLVMVAPFLIWAQTLPRTDEDYPSKLTVSRIIDNRERAFAIIPAMTGEAMNPHQEGCVWLLLPLAAVLGFRGFRQFEVRCLWFLIVAQLAIYVLIYEITPWDLNALLPLTVDRLILHVTPLAVVLIGLHWRSIGRSEARVVVRQSTHL